MASNLAQRRAAKALRRKAVVGGKRKAELLAGSLAGQVNQAAGAPIRHCLISDGWEQSGMGTLILTRGVSSAHLAMGNFLLDTFCLGIKDVMFRPIDGGEFEALREVMDAAAPLVPIEPAYARKLLRDLAAWAQSNGFLPHRDFAAVERLFGSVRADQSDAAFRFGEGGQPYYIPGPSESPEEIRERAQQLAELPDANMGIPIEG